MPTIDERALTTFARLIKQLPPSALDRLSGGPIVRDGQTLDRAIALVLKIGEKTNPVVLPATDPASLAKFRAEQSKGARIAAGGPLAVGAVRDLEVKGATGSLRARHYAPRHVNGSPAPLLVFFHGGGFVFGDVDTHDAPCRYLCEHAGAHVLSVEYRLAPEHRFPAAALDAHAAFLWAVENAASLGADPKRVGVAGDSAGGNLSAAASWMAVNAGGPRPVCQILVYPATDRRVAWESLSLFAEGYFLTKESIDWYDLQYSGGDAATLGDPRRTPLAAETFAGLPRTLVVTAGFDPLRDEGEAYGAALKKAGVDVTVRRFDSLVHGFFNMVGISETSRNAVVEIAGATRLLLGG